MEDQMKTAFEDMWDKLWGWFNALITNLPNLLVAIIVFVLTIILARIIRRTIRRWMSRTRASSSVSNLIGNVGAVIIILGGLYLSLAALDLDGAAKGLVTTASVSGLIIGLALQNTFANTFAGIILSLIDDVQIGDWIEVNGFRGEVQRISLRCVTIKAPDNNLVFIPNKEILDNSIRNLTKTSRSRIILDCGVAYDSDLDLVRETTIKALKAEFTDLKDEEIDFYYTEFGDSSINFTTRYWVDARNAIQENMARSRAIISIKKHFDGVDINIPFPIRTLYFGEPARVISDREKTSDQS